jgi:class 3 adenylate cyclase
MNDHLAASRQHQLRDSSGFRPEAGRTPADSELIYTDVEFDRHRARRNLVVVRVSALIAFAVILPWMVIALYLGNIPLLMLQMFAMASVVLALALCRQSQPNAATHVLGLGMMVFVTGLAAIVEGVVEGHDNYVHRWLMVIAMVALMIFQDQRYRIRLAYVGVCALLYAAIELKWLGGTTSMGILSPEARAADANFTMLAIFVAVIVITRVFVADIARAGQLLAMANNRLETLVENMLPRPIAERLRREGRSFADGIAECSVLFADIVDFTILAERVKPTDLVHLLNRLFARFDYLAEAQGVEKIKTIGDAYMVAAGLPEPRPDHAEALVRLALDMWDAMKDFPGVSLRIGINSGSVVAGVIGKKRFIYDLWGDAVNVAQRMESNGLPGAIQVTRSTRDLVAEKFELVTRGEVEIKGKGRMETFLVMGNRKLA